MIRFVVVYQKKGGVTESVLATGQILSHRSSHNKKLPRVTEKRRTLFAI